MVGNESANTIGGKGFSHSRCLLTRFQAGDGHDKAPKIGGTPAADHEIRSGMWLGLSPPRLSSDLHAVMHPQIVEADRRLTLRYVANRPHCRAMYIGLTESRDAVGTDFKRPDLGREDVIEIPFSNILD